MMRAPRFWGRDGALPILLTPLAAVWAAAAARRVARPGWRAPVPVICCGNATVGGTGKTTLALDLGARLARRGPVAFLTRGYGGQARGVLRVDPLRHDARLVGDEALLLAAVAPTYLAADRVAGARAAIADGARALVMDDGLQNPGLVKDVALLVIDGGFGFGNGRVVPAGPLRERLAAAAARCRAAVLIGRDIAGAAAALPPALPILRAQLCPTADIAALHGRRVVAFAGIGRPDKFFAMLRQAGVDLVAQRAFPDHHRLTVREFAAIMRLADGMDAVVVTTPKDAVRLLPAQRARVAVVGVQLVWEDAAAIERLLEPLP